MRRLTKEELRFLFEETAVDLLIACLKNMLDQRRPSEIHVSPKELGCALECFAAACGLVYAVFQFLQLKTDDSLLTRMSLNELLRLNGEEWCVC